MPLQSAKHSMFSPTHPVAFYKEMVALLPTRFTLHSFWSYSSDFQTLNKVSWHPTFSSIKVTLQHALMSTESGFSDILRFRNLLIALQPIGLSKFCKKYWIAHILGNRKIYLT